MDINALKLTCCFAFSPNMLGYCGKGTAGDKFLNCLNNNVGEGVEEELTHFIVLHPYLKTIAHSLDLPIFSKEVIEAYWIGNDNLSRISDSVYYELLKNFSIQGVPTSFVEELKSKKPNKFIPTHLFQVLHVGVGKASGSVPFNVETINSCMVRWGKVLKVTKNYFTVNINSLEVLRGKYSLIEIKEKIENDKCIVKDLRKGDTVAVHWRMIVKKMSNDECEKIRYWTNEVLSSL